MILRGVRSNQLKNKKAFFGSSPACAVWSTIWLLSNAAIATVNLSAQLAIMKLVSAFVGLAAFGGVALSSTAASAAPIDVPASTTGIVVPAGYFCNEWGHCWHRHYYGGGYDHPHYWGGYGWYRHWGGYGGWHRPWGYGGGYRWHHWHQW